MNKKMASNSKIIEFFKEDDAKALKRLMDAGADINAMHYSDKKTYLHYAVEYDAINCFHILIKAGADLNIKDAEKQTPLHLAMRKNSVEYANVLILSGAKLNVKDRYGWTPMHIAASNNSANHLIFLIAAGACMYKRDETDSTPLHLAARNKAKDSMEILIAAGADIIDATNDRGQSFLECINDATLRKEIEEYIKCRDALDLDGCENVS